MMLGHGAPDWGVVAIFVTVYLGMILGGLPRLKLDRSGVALLGAIGVIGLGVTNTGQAAQAVDWPTVLLLFSFMVLSAVFSNDIVCLAMTPVVARLCLQRRLDPVPFLLGLACAANIGSAATLIGNPQNMLIGSVLQLPFGAYVRQALPPVLMSLAVLWVWLVWGPQARLAGLPRLKLPPDLATELRAGEPFDAWQSIKGLVVAAALLLVFLFTDWPREVAALVGAGVLLLSRRFHSSRVMGLVDWDVLVLFKGLFVVNHAFESTGLAAQAVAWLGAQGVHLADPGPLFVAGVGLSNLLSNVPAVMLLLPHLKGMEAGVTLALVSTLAGNLLLVGSIANLIVVDLAQRSGVIIDWRAHARVGIPVTLMTLAIVWLWLSGILTVG